MLADEKKIKTEKVKLRNTINKQEIIEALDAVLYAPNEILKKKIIEEIFLCEDLHDFLFDAFREVHELKRSKIL